MITDPDARAARRAAIEERLRARLAHDRASAPPPGPWGISLLCLACRGVNTADARFCTRCGVKFNATAVVSDAPVSPGAGS